MTLCSALWCLHYTSMWLFTPVAMNFLNVARSYVCSLNKEWVHSKAVPIVFIAVSLVLTIVTWQGVWGILPFIASIFATIGGWQKNPQILRIMTIPVCLCWVTFNLINRSWAGMTNDSLSLISLIVALTRYKAAQKKKLKDTDVKKDRPFRGGLFHKNKQWIYPPIAVCISFPLRLCRLTPSLAENDIKPQNFISSVAPRQLLLKEKPIVAFAPGEKVAQRAG